MRAGREYALKRALAKLSDQFDVVIIDCPPSLGVLTLNGLTAADEVIVPLQCETLAHRGVGQFLRTVADVQQITNPDLRLLGALPTLYDSAPPTPATCCSTSPTVTTCRCSPRRSRARCASPRPALRVRR